MKRIFVSLLFLYSLQAEGQRRLKELQVLPFVRFDKFPAFAFNYGRASNDTLSMKGLSPGLNINYKYSLNNKTNLIGGIGYYRYSFSKLKRINSMFGVSDARPIDYPSFNNLFYHTHNYAYNNLSVNLGVERLFIVKRDLQLNMGAHFSNMFTYHQVYKIGINGITYRTNGKALFAQSVYITAGLEQTIGKFKVGPQFIIPLFDNWRKDDAFEENNKERRHKLFNGIGIGIQINYPLKKK